MSYVWVSLFGFPLLAPSPDWSTYAPCWIVWKLSPRISRISSLRLRDIEISVCCRSFGCLRVGSSDLYHSYLTPLGIGIWRGFRRSKTGHSLSLGYALTISGMWGCFLRALGVSLSRCCSEGFKTVLKGLGCKVGAYRALSSATSLFPINCPFFAVILGSVGALGWLTRAGVSPLG